MTLALPRTADGTDVIAFAEAMCRPSKLAGPLHLRPWQKQLLIDLFEVGADGRRRYRQALVGMPRKNGKSTLSAAMALWALLVDSEPGPEVYSVAGDRQQAGIVFREAKAMIEAEPELSERCRVYVNHIEVPDSGGVYRVLSAEAPRAQGLNPSFVVFDEVHVQPNEDLWAAMVTGMGTRRQPLIVGITTAGFNKSSLCGRLYEYGKQVLSGEVDDPSFFLRWWEPANPGADWRSPAVWAEANPAYADFLHPEFFAELVKSTPESTFRRYHLNQWTSAKESWLPHGVWDNIAAPARVVEQGEPVVLFFDGAWTGDSVALVGCTINNPHLFVAGHWEPEPGEPVDPDAVEAAILKAHSDMNVKRIGADPFLWRREIMRWRQQGVPVVEWPTSAPSRMAPACGEFYRAIMDSQGDEKRLTHDGNPALARHINNSTVKDDQRGRRIVKQSAGAKIDLAVAAVGAHDMARKMGTAQRSAKFAAF